MSEEEVLELDALERIDLYRFTKADFYGSQIAANLAAANTQKTQQQSNFVLKKPSIVPAGWLDLRPTADPDKIKKSIFAVFGIKANKDAPKNG